MKRRSMMMKGKRVFAVVALLFACLFVTACGEKPSFKTEYQAVFMDNGQVFFGKLEKTGAPFPLLRDVFYIGRQTSPDGKEVRNMLIKRGNEWHGPDYMYINGQHVVVVEPVAPNSRVAQLIKEANAQQPRPQTQPPEGAGK